jgi:hypothetical protein
VEIPEPIRRSDEALHALLKRVAFSRYLNPSNVAEARLAFRNGAESPPFAYHSLDIADELMRELDAIEPPRDHPAGALIGSSMDSLRRLIRALHERSAEAFDAMNQAANWYPTQELLQKRYVSGSPTELLNVPASELIEHFELALQARQMSDWRIDKDIVMSARVMVDSAKKLIRVNPNSRFRNRDITRLVVHEIDVHARRSINGSQQALLCFSTGLPGSLATEEGLAMVAEETSGTASPGVLARQAEVCRAINEARSLGFRALYNSLCERLGSGLAWGICLRVKRGLKNPDEPGVYAKDSVYLTGRNMVRQWLDDGGDIQKLYVGKVGVDDPVDQWIEQGWVSIQPVPQFWLSG